MSDTNFIDGESAMLVSSLTVPCTTAAVPSAGVHGLVVPGGRCRRPGPVGAAAVALHGLEQGHEVGGVADGRQEVVQLGVLVWKRRLNSVVVNIE